MIFNVYVYVHPIHIHIYIYRLIKYTGVRRLKLVQMCSMQQIVHVSLYFLVFLGGSPPKMNCPCICDQLSTQNLVQEVKPIEKEQREDQTVVDAPLSNDKPAKMSLEQSMQKMKEARAKRQEGSNKQSVMKKPSMKSQPKSASQSGLSDLPMSEKPSASGKVLKRPAKACQVKTVSKKTNKVISKQEKNKLRDAILAKLDLQTKKKFKHGCPKCRQRPLCTLSCWRSRGY